MQRVPVQLNNMNRRELLSGALVLPLVPYISSKYKTPKGHEPYELWVGGNDWQELPFDDIMVNDTIRRKRTPQYSYKVTRINHSLTENVLQVQIV